MKRYIVKVQPRISLGHDYVRISNKSGSSYTESYVGSAEGVLRVIQSEYAPGLLEDVENALAALSGQTVAWFGWIHVPDSSRHRGVGGRLLDFTIEWLFSEANVVAVFALSSADSDEDPFALRDWYVRHGAVVLTHDALSEASEIAWTR